MSAQVLIVDDSSSMRQMINFTLSEAGYEVQEAANGKQGLEKLTTLQPKLIITDIHMPEMDGLEFIRSVRENASFKFTPIIVLTTESEQDMQQEGKKAGATAWLVKPFTPEKLNDTVKKVAG